jgi:FMN phosphatase YigB (HAD superfamily)
MKKLLNNKKIVVLFDIDYTIFNTVMFTDDVYEKNYKSIDKETFYKSLEEIRVNFKQVLSEKNTMTSNIAGSLWYQAGLGKNFYEETIAVLEEISKMATVGIFSKGDERFQKEKIKSISRFLNEDNINITLDKYKKLPEIIKKHKDDRLVIVDDILKVLHTAKTLNEDIYTVWIKREVNNKYHLFNQEQLKDFSPDVIMSNLRELIPLIKKMKE